MIRYGLIFLLAVTHFSFSIANPAIAKNAAKTIRLAVVNTPEYSGLMTFLLKEFEETSGYSVEIYSGKDVYDVALNGDADIVISHYGKSELEDFITEGYGYWPKMVFSNQSVIVGPEKDPAKIKNLESSLEAFQRIEKTKSTYVINNIDGLVYLTDIIASSAKWPAEASWIYNEGELMVDAMKVAEKLEGYAIWGALPFLRYKNKTGSSLEIMVSADHILQRIMSSTIVNPEKISGVNVEGAQVLQNYLLAPATQAKIASYRSNQSELQLWWPAGRDN